MKKINEFADVEELTELAEELDQSTNTLKELMENNVTACLADIDPDVLESRIHLLLNQAYLQSNAVIKLAVADFASQHPDEDIECLLEQILQLINETTEIMGRSTLSAEIELQLAEQQFDDALDEFDE